MLRSIGVFQVCVGEEPRAKFTQLSCARRYQAYLERKGYKNVCVYILAVEEA